jgi:RNA polymerase sigma-70 factor, ECF subfamily
MGTHSSGIITQLLEKTSKGDEKALEQLMPLIYDELYRLAEGYRREHRERSLQSGTLGKELLLRFLDGHRISWQNRAQFLGIAAQLMRQILVDQARHHYSAKVGGNRLAVSLEDIATFGAEPDTDLLALHDALNRLEKLDPDQGRIVELRFFGGLTIEETAEVMHISHAKAERTWRLAKAFLKRELTRTNIVSTTIQNSKAADVVTEHDNKPDIFVVWDPEVVAIEDYASLIESIGDLVRLEGGIGVKRIRNLETEIPVSEELLV